MKEDRGSGWTSRQVLTAPQQAVFVWCNDKLGYPRDLARHLDRTDLKIVAPSWVSSGRMPGYRGLIFVDHAANLSLEQRDAIRFCMDEAHRTDG